MTFSESDLLNLIEKIRPWKRGDRRAPHKPLLLLLALGRIQRGESRLVAFSEVEDDLRRLLKKYGPSRQSYHPEYPVVCQNSAHLSDPHQITISRS